MRIFNKSLLVDNNNVYFDENHVINGIKNEKKLFSYERVRYNSYELGEEFINSIFNNKLLFEAIYEYFISDSCPMNISLVNDNKVYNYYIYKKNLIETVDVLIKEKKLILNEKNILYLKKLTDSIKKEMLEERLNNKSLCLKVNNKYLSISYNLIFDFLNKSDEDFFAFFKKNEKNNETNKSFLLYAVTEFYKEYEQAYLFDDIIKERINYIKEQKEIEFIVYEKKFTSEDENSIYKKIEINKEIELEIINNMPQNLTKLEKAFYTYIKLCKLLNYDLEYFTVRQKGPEAEKHKNIYNAKNISLKNNNVVCYEFNTIFANILNKFDIDFEIRQSGENYGDSHAWLRVKIDDLLISFDSVHRIFWDFDLLQAKINNPLKGIKLYNKNSKALNEFNNNLNKIYNIIAKEENKEVKEDKYDDIINDESMQVGEKLNKLVQVTEYKNLPDIESISYLLNMHKQYKEKNYNDKVEYELMLKNVNNESKVCVLFTSYNKFLKDENKKYSYFLYVPGELFVRYDGETLKDYLEFGMLDFYYKDKDRYILGIDYISKKEFNMSSGRIK